MIARKSPQGGSSNLRGVRDPERLKHAFNTALRCFTEHDAARDADAAERGRLWRAMRVLGTFDAPMAALVAVATPDMAARLIGELVAAGILSSSAGPDDCPRYRLSRDPGAALPVGEIARA